MAGLGECEVGRAVLVSASRGVAITFQSSCFPTDTLQKLEATNNAVALAALAASLDDVTAATDESVRRNTGVFWRELVDSARSEVTSQESDEDYSTFRTLFFGSILDAQLKEENSGSFTDGSAYTAIIHRLLSLGPNGCGSNSIMTAEDTSLFIWESCIPDRPCLLGPAKERDPELVTSIRLNCPTSSDSPTRVYGDNVWSRLRSAICAGFQAVAEAGPLMQEPLHGVCFFVTRIDVTAEFAGLPGSDQVTREPVPRTSTDDSTVAKKYPIEHESVGQGREVGGTIEWLKGTESGASQTELSPVGPSTTSSPFSSGYLIAEVRDALKLAVLALPVRLVEPVYSCHLQCDQSQLGNLYSVLSRRRGEVTKEDIIEGTSLFLLSATLPVHESFGFAQELLKKTSGSGTAPQLVLSHYSVLGIDPFWKPKTEEEVENYGENVYEKNLSRKIIEDVRRRKGLPVEEKVVQNAEKQRTLTKMK